MNPLKWKQYNQLNHPPALLRSEEDPARRQEVQRTLEKYFPKTLPKDAEILCLGCGDGFEIDVIRGFGYTNVTGITNDNDEIAHRDYADITFGDIHDMPFRDARFDYVWSKETLEHITAPFIALQEIWRVMKDGATFFHLISTGLEKQRETYHVSCFPTWLWYDLLTKTKHEVTTIHEGHRSEVGFEGRKAGLLIAENRYAYDLQGCLDGVTKAKLVL